MSPDDREEIKRHFGVVAEGLRSDIQLVAEGVAMANERLDRVEGEISWVKEEVSQVRDELHSFRDETRQSFTELRSQIKLSYSELDRRLCALEEGHRDLSSRVGRIEAKLAS